VSPAEYATRMVGDCRVKDVADVTPELAERLRGLVTQLSASAVAPTDSELRSVAASAATHLLVAYGEDEAVLGMLTVAVFRIPTGVRAWVEDVVVDEEARGRGVGRALTARAVELAESRGARTVELTSRASRAAANTLYQRMGFVTRETNVYRLTLG
jgi:ribosomal protein S18 acetylase RimI-like enzyme